MITSLSTSILHCHPLDDVPADLLWCVLRFIRTGICGLIVVRITVYSNRHCLRFLGGLLQIQASELLPDAINEHTSGYMVRSHGPGISTLFPTCVADIHEHRVITRVCRVDQDDLTQSGGSLFLQMSLRLGLKNYRLLVLRLIHTQGRLLSRPLCLESLI